MNTLKLISVLLDYPQDALWEHAAELRSACHELPDEAQRAVLSGFADVLLGQDSLVAQARWIETFDRGRAMSLLMFEHIHGESRDRGQAMVDLLENYQQKGYELASKELPDYLPLLLEFLALQEEAEAHEWLRHLAHILALLASRAGQRDSPYAAMFRLLCEIAGASHELETVRVPAGEVRDDTPEAMDAVWEEEQVRFGPESTGEPCPSTRVRAPARAEPVHIIGS
ncbi:MAG: nitrate reductase molybdenum cofactor assembly chaperone [Pseudomonadales bacterium]|nr:nitrate reductase molybdenum cofactor assembly chaperone [Pseudomonadales bacterium]